METGLRTGCAVRADDQAFGTVPVAVLGAFEDAGLGGPGLLPGTEMGGSPSSAGVRR